MMIAGALNVYLSCWVSASLARPPRRSGFAFQEASIRALRRYSNPVTSALKPSSARSRLARWISAYRKSNPLRRVPLFTDTADTVLRFVPRDVAVRDRRPHVAPLACRQPRLVFDRLERCALVHELNGFCQVVDGDRVTTSESAN